jgi:hypothetical protein
MPPRRCLPIFLLFPFGWLLPDDTPGVLKITPGVLKITAGVLKITPGVLMLHGVNAQEMFPCWE